MQPLTVFWHNKTQKKRVSIAWINYQYQTPSLDAQQMNGSSIIFWPRVLIGGPRSCIFRPKTPGQNRKPCSFKDISTAYTVLLTFEKPLANLCIKGQEISEGNWSVLWLKKTVTIRSSVCITIADCYSFFWIRRYSKNQWILFLISALW